MIDSIVPVVEGHGEVEAVPILLRRIAAISGAGGFRLERPLRCSKHKLVKAGELERVVELAARRAGPKGAVLIVLDSDESCPKETAPELLARARIARKDRTIALTLANHEFEAWFLAAIESIRGRRGIRPDATFDGDPEGMRGAKGCLESLMNEGASYSETLDQPALAALMDIDMARRRSPSFDKFFRDVERFWRGG